MIPKDFELREGDVVSVECKVGLVSRQSEKVWVRPPGRWDDIGIEREHLTLVRTDLLQYDRVVSRPPECAGLTLPNAPVGKVIAVHGDKAWVEWPSGNSVEKVRHLLRVADPEPEPEEEPQEELPEPPPAPETAPAAGKEVSDLILNLATAVTDSYRAGMAQGGADGR